MTKRDFEKERTGSMSLHAFLKMGEVKEVMLQWHGVGQFYRTNGEWTLLPQGGADLEEATVVYISPARSIEFIDKWDTEDSELNDELDFFRATAAELETMFPEVTLTADNSMEGSPVTAAVGNPGENQTFSCPPATQDLLVNTENRNKAIKSVGYGPLNPDRPNDDFWEEKAKLWQTTADEAKTSRCANCAMFIKTPEMLDCINQGIDATNEENAWDIIDAGDLGYCEALDFKCAAGRTCDAWVAGGPVTGKEDK